MIDVLPVRIFSAVCQLAFYIISVTIRRTARMSEFIDSEASEGEDEEELTARDKKKLKKMNKNRLQDSSEEEEGNVFFPAPLCQGRFF